MIPAFTMVGVMVVTVVEELCAVSFNEAASGRVHMNGRANKQRSRWSCGMSSVPSYHDMTAI
jgi:hypothetical protein